ncbi:hypothetical protein [uncultured Jatrophihabitans sp.]|uniref:hypothetical protein n=1 Tax=uncultured Jatrophihabitans sp. TaxID=1610747 RepID=UPI0035C96D5C
MRRLLARWTAIVALVAGVTVGATALPASAHPTSGAASSDRTSSVHTVRPMDWWV